MSILSKLFKKKSGKASLILDNKGNHTIGVKAPSSLEIPSLDTSPVVYFGKISKQESYLPSLDFDLHLVCPTFLNFTEPISLDYSNPDKPIFIHKDQIENNDFCDKEFEEAQSKTLVTIVHDHSRNLRGKNARSRHNGRSRIA